MSRRDKIESAAPETSGLFLPDRWDAALLGYASCGSYGGVVSVVPCYGYQAMKAVAKDFHNRPEDIMRDVYLSSISSESCIIMHKFKRIPMWRRISEGRIPRWEALDRCVIGLGFHGVSGPGVVYNKALCIDTLMKIQAVSEGTGAAGEFAAALRFLDSSIIPVGLGNNTPYFLTTV